MDNSSPVDISTRFAGITILLENAAGVASEGQSPALTPDQNLELVTELTDVLTEVMRQLQELLSHLG